jgi:CCR4-NOT transcription complex subunit 1
MIMDGAQVLEPCKDSKVFKPPNPWVQSILALVAEIYAQDKLKLNLKFEIEMLFRNLNMQISDAKPSNTLSAHKRQIMNNADFAPDKAVAPPPAAASPAQQVAFLIVEAAYLLHVDMLRSCTSKQWL